MPHRRALGRDAEDRAAALLQSKGYTILTRRYSARAGEIDLVALDGETLVFVEVKMRRSSGLLPEEAVNHRKRARLFIAAEEWLASYDGPDRGVRYDIVAIDPQGIRHYEEAFWP